MFWKKKPKPCPLAATGDEAFDAECQRLWRDGDFDALAVRYLNRISSIDDLHPTDVEYAVLRQLRRNQMLCAALRFKQEASFLLPSEIRVEFAGLNPQDPFCPYAFDPKAVGLDEYLADPDMFPCRECLAAGRKFFCDILARPR